MLVTLSKKSATTRWSGRQARPFLGATSNRPAIFGADIDQGSKETAMKYSWARSISQHHIVIDLLNTKPFGDDGYQMVQFAC
jgi:hypothetical protein